MPARVGIEPKGTRGTTTTTTSSRTGIDTGAGLFGTQTKSTTPVDTGAGLFGSTSTNNPITTSTTTTPFSTPLPAAGSGLMLNGVAVDPTTLQPLSPVADLGTANTTNTPTSSSTQSIGDLTNSMYAALGNAQAASINSATDSAANALVKALSTSLSNLTDAQYGIANSYYDKKNQAAAQSDIGKVNYAQMAAAQGIKGNAAMQNELYSNIGLQNSLTNLNKGEAADNASIERQKVLARNGLESDLAALYAKRDFELAQSGNTVEAQRTQATIDQILSDADKQVAAEQQAKNDFIATLGRVYGKEQSEIDRIKGDGDPSNDWQIQYIEAALSERLNAKPTGSGGGTGGTSTQTFASLDSQLGEMYKMYADPVTGEISDAGKTAMYNYVAAYGGKYATQLAAKYGLSAPAASNTVGTRGTASKINPDQLVASLSRGGDRNGLSQQQIEDTLTGYLSSGQISEADLAYILNKLGYS